MQKNNVLSYSILCCDKITLAKNLTKDALAKQIKSKRKFEEYVSSAYIFKHINLHVVIKRRAFKDLTFKDEQAGFSNLRLKKFITLKPKIL